MKNKLLKRIKCKREVKYHPNGLVTYIVTTPLERYSLVFNEITYDYYKYLHSLQDHKLISLFRESHHVIQNY